LRIIFRVDDIYEIKESTVEWDGPRNSKFLMIGKNLVKEEIKKMLDEAVVKT
jgi:hypothetical protein